MGQYLSAVIPFIEQYEKKEFPIGPATPEEVLGFLMEQHDLSQYDLAKELGGQPVVSQILRGKRRLTREHIERLSKRFGVTPATFLPRRDLGLTRRFSGPAALLVALAGRCRRYGALCRSKRGAHKRHPAGGKDRATIEARN